MTIARPNPDAASGTEGLAIVADIGGTNSRIALAHGEDIVSGSARRYSNDDFATLADAIRYYLSETGATPAAACVAIAGPVQNNAGELTNRDWRIDGETLCSATGAKQGVVLNDLAAQGYALASIRRDGLRPIFPARSTPPGSDVATSLVIGVGTGFNAAIVHERAGMRLVCAAEAGHVTPPLRSPQELLLTGFGDQPCGIEDMISGMGLRRIDRHIPLLAGGTIAQERPTGDILAALDQGEERATLAVEKFLHILARVAGDLALHHVPFAGIYVIGGLARAVEPHMTRFGFEAEFRHKGRFAWFMESFALTLITDDNTALSGCASRLSRG